mgnify:CR=1 FL=1
MYRYNVIVDRIVLMVRICLLILFGIGLYLGIRCFFFQAEDGIRDLVRSRGLGDVYKRQECARAAMSAVPVGAN